MVININEELLSICQYGIYPLQPSASIMRGFMTIKNTFMRGKAQCHLLSDVI